MSEEPLGGKEKFWIVAPDGNEYCFKYARSDPDGTNVRGEDWAEWAVHHLAGLISVPTAVVIPGQHDGRRGSLSRAVWHEREQLIHGNELLTRQNPVYDATAERENPGYTVDAVRAALDGVAAPTVWESPLISGFDAWAGYVMLDAWVAGRDRHHENWAAINQSGSLRLAPSYDHGNALGFQESEKQAAKLAEDDERLARWSRKGCSFHFAGKPPLVDVANTALQMAGDAVQSYWRSKLAAVTLDSVVEIFEQIPYLSDQGRRFRIKLLAHNQERIVNDQ
ncbi:hypothetical protein H7J08_05745 [Mycobacterium frederiksbergense]|uniref:hypothetical protein n=1 Tax=Mycolicibacterium frederiksbergense TaxID=117567 RepID=UPI0021F2E326|nr:hypothetical protein [Mycolicibacterium frederiksbergense]MCV7044175.1 hypothetical protein [Mycolicibacterium frederiksbergense]